MIDALHKPAGVRCSNCQPDNLCAIYDERPNPCRAFLCGWRLIAQLGEDWRPDRCGILLMPAEHAALPRDGPTTGIQILLAHAGAIHKRELPGLIAAWIEAKLPVFLAISLASGNPSKAAHLNSALDDIVRRKDQPAMIHLLENIVHTLSDGGDARASWAGSSPRQPH